MTNLRVLFVTGRLAEPSLRELLDTWGRDNGVNYEIAVLPITVAALMHVHWVQRKLTVPAETNRVILPGWCGGNLSELEAEWKIPFERGPKDLRDLPEFFGRQQKPIPNLDDYSIEIIAEINHAPRLTTVDLLTEAERLRSQGADVIDLGNIPGESWAGVGPAVAALRANGFRVSIDSFDRREVEAAVENGA